MTNERLKTNERYLNGWQMRYVIFGISMKNMY